jgi:hypothetical protein
MNSQEENKQIVSDVERKQILLSIFWRKGAEGETIKAADISKDYCVYPPLTQLLEEGELPIIFWLDEGIAHGIISTRKVICDIAGVLELVKLTEMLKVSPKSFPLSQADGLEIKSLSKKSFVFSLRPWGAIVGSMAPFTKLPTQKYKNS